MSPVRSKRWSQDVRDFIWRMRDQKSPIIAAACRQKFGFDYTSNDVSRMRGSIRVEVRLAEMRQEPVKNWSEAQTDTLYREWERGTKVSVIAAMTGKTEEQVKSKREYCKLPPRRKGRTALPHERPLKSVHIWIDEKTLEAIDAAAKDVDRSRSGYIASILEAKFGLKSIAPHRRRCFEVGQGRWANGPALD